MNINTFFTALLNAIILKISLTYSQQFYYGMCLRLVYQTHSFKKTKTE